MSMNARLIAGTLARLAGLGEAPSPRGQCTKGPADAILTIYRARRGLLGRGEAVSSISCWLAMRLDGVDLSMAGLGLVSGRETGLRPLISRAGLFERNPSPGTLVPLLRVIAGELASGCHRDPTVEEEISVLEARMRRLGIIIGVALPVLFVLTLYRSAVMGLLGIVAAASLWGLVRRDGARFQWLNIEKAWRECTLPERELERMLSGRGPVPSVFEILGIREPSLD